MKMPDCGDNSCLYAKNKKGMRTNGGCRCDICPKCGYRTCHPKSPKKHYKWCPQQDWLPEHHRSRLNEE
jgi:hypothetical protein